MAQAAQLLLLLLFLAAGAGAGAGAAAGPATNRTLLVFLLAGQSNMGGRGGATSGTWDGVVPPDCKPSPRILRLSPELRWEEAREPLHQGIDLHNVLGVGPGMPFARAILRSRRLPPHAVVGLVPCAQGATPIASWSRGTQLYGRMIARARAALSSPSSSSSLQGPAGRPKLAALLWYQGEADTIRRQDAQLYTPRMEAFVRDVGLATGQGKFIDLVRQAQKRVNNLLPNVKYVDAKGLPIATDYTHLTTPAQVRLGNMLATSYLATL
ncbi:putative carbohydrate esterase [Dichanthelium oligosanthes]|uniref:Putative carbohydrate esterase n=1 Tax=Dichanthelium oligosanthes TaxID=888268 RepID=A0A1E5VK74_9POAL|nr:putative carbohydrate esterase [Dichanthelium oligosanthes]